VIDPDPARHVEFDDAERGGGNVVARRLVGSNNQH